LALGSSPDSGGGGNLFAGREFAFERSPLKLVQIYYHFEFSDTIEAILDDCEIDHFVRYALVEGKDRDGKHYGSKVFPGNSSVVQALVSDEAVDELLEALRGFKESGDSHRHLTAVVLPVESSL
jgi:hypothetical protein